MLAGEMTATVVAAMAQMERRLIGQRTKDALAVKRAEGVQLGRPREMSEETVERIADLYRSAPTRRRDRPEAERGWCPDSTWRALAFAGSEAGAFVGSVVKERQLPGDEKVSGRSFAP